jgi:hypothetical protein
MSGIENVGSAKNDDDFEVEKIEELAEMICRGDHTLDFRRKKV